MTDIIDRLDNRRRQETEITELELLLLDAADEIEKLRARLLQSPPRIGAPVQMDITNHHNALLCPHCNPKSLKFNKS